MDQQAPTRLRREALLDELVDLALTAGTLDQLTDKYFTNTQLVVEANGDAEVTYAVFLRRRSIAALDAVVRLVERLVPAARVKRFYQEGEIVPAERKMLEITGPMSRLSAVETLMLQKAGIPSVAANNAYEMCLAIPYAAFIDMHARHASGPEMNLLAAYGASVGSRAARKADPAVKGFIGSSQDLTAPFYDFDSGIGTMPHALVGYAGGDVLEATKLLAARLPELATVTALVDYRGLEITEFSFAPPSGSSAKPGSTATARNSASASIPMAAVLPRGSITRDPSTRWAGGSASRASTTSSNWCSAAAPSSSIPAISWWTRSAASCSAKASRWHRPSMPARRLDEAGFEATQIVVSSGFDPQKCQIMGHANAPVNVIGSGSFLPATLTETYATADIIIYNGDARVKVGREFLLD